MHKGEKHINKINKKKAANAAEKKAIALAMLNERKEKEKNNQNLYNKLLKKSKTKMKVKGNG